MNIFFFPLAALLVTGTLQLNAAEKSYPSTLNSEIITINKTTMYKDNSICKCDYLIGNDMIIIEGNVTIEAKDTSQFIGTFKCRENAVLTLITKTVPKERFFTIHAEASSSYTILDK
jgi:hypothetical protein